MRCLGGEENLFKAKYGADKTGIFFHNFARLDDKVRQISLTSLHSAICSEQTAHLGGCHGIGNIWVTITKADKHSYCALTIKVRGKFYRLDEAGILSKSHKTGFVSFASGCFSNYIFSSFDR